MKTKNIEVVFHKNPTEKNIPWKNHVEEIINGIKSGVQNSFKVYMKNLMPIGEMESVAKELCDAIKYHINCEAKYVRHEECIATGYTDMLASATYHIEFIH